MAEKSGVQSRIVCNPYAAASYGTPTQAGAGHLMAIDNETFAINSDELTEVPVGSGVEGKVRSEIGNTNPGGTLTQTVRTEDAFDALIASMFGQETVTTVSAGAVFLHSYTMQTQSLHNLVCFAKEKDSTGVEEYIDGIVTGIQLSASINQYLKGTATLINSLRRISGTTNTNASMASATQPTNYNLSFRDVSRLWLNARTGGALSSGDVINTLTAIDINIQRLREYISTARGATGKEVARVTGEPPMTGIMTLTLSKQDGQAFWTYFDTGTELKASFLIEGPTITGAHKYYIRVDLPCLKVVKEPRYNLSGGGVQPVTVELDVLVPSSAPTGMGSVYPFICKQNTLSTRSIP